MMIVRGRRFLLTSLVRNFCSGQYKRRPPPKFVDRDPYGRPMPPPRVFEAIESLNKLHPKEIHAFRYIFSELLGLPHPPPTVPVPGDKFAVRLIEYGEGRKEKVLRQVAWVIWQPEEVRSLSDLGLKPAVDIVENVPSVVKQGILKEEAEEIVAKLKAVGGVAVMEPME